MSLVLLLIQLLIGYAVYLDALKVKANAPFWGIVTFFIPVVGVVLYLVWTRMR